MTTAQEARQLRMQADELFAKAARLNQKARDVFDMREQARITGEIIWLTHDGHCLQEKAAELEAMEHSTR